jgi:hypothetical protein
MSRVGTPSWFVNSPTRLNPTFSSLRSGRSLHRRPGAGCARLCSSAVATQYAAISPIHYLYDNRYLIDCLRRFAGKFAGVGLVDRHAPDAADQLQRLVEEVLMKVIAALTEPGAIRQYLDHVSLPARAPPITPARQHQLDFDQAA